MNLKEKKTLKKFYEFCLSTCGKKRIKKIKWIMTSSGDMIEKDLTKLKTEDVVKFLSKLNQSDFSLWSKNDFKKIFKRFLKWQYGDLEMVEGSKVKDAFKGVSKKKAFNKEKINKTTLIKPEELEKILRATKNLKWKAIFSLLYESALRPCEIKILKWENIKFDDSRNLASVSVVSPKTKELRAVPIRDCLLHLKRWKAEYQFSDRTEKDFVFPAQHTRGASMGEGVIAEMLKRTCDLAKIRRLFPYMFRHSRIYFIQKNLGARIASKYAGHSLETSEIYDHLDSDDVEEAMLSKIYTTEELTEDKRNKLEKEIEALKGALSFIMEELKLKRDFSLGKITKEEFREKKKPFIEELEGLEL